jgi:hypothetical protein
LGGLGDAGQRKTVPKLHIRDARITGEPDIAHERYNGFGLEKPFPLYPAVLVNDQRMTKEVITGGLSPSLAYETTRPERMYIVVEVVDYDVDQLGSKSAVHGWGTGRKTKARSNKRVLS